VKIEHHGSGATAHHRLLWSIPASSAPSHFLPLSATTGPFSHFVVRAGGKELGRAYALAFVIDQDLYKGWKSGKRSAVTFAITGHAFDGSVIGTFTGLINLM
jgi:hypothetical protein